MKKHLIAAAVAAAVAVPAMAQVSIGGNVDLSYDMGDRNTGDTFDIGRLSTPAITLSGSEDLGGGLKAFFNINSRLGQVFGNEGTVGGGQTAAERNGSLNFGDRGAQIGLTGVFGEIALGKTTGTALGGVIRGGVVGNLSLLDESTFGDRPKDMISYTTPAFSGFSGRYIYQSSTASAEASLQYRSGPLQVNVAQNTIKAADENEDQGTNAVIAGSDTGLRVSYDFGFAAVNVSYIKFETLTEEQKRTMNSVGVTLPVPGLKGVVLAVESGNKETADGGDNKMINSSLVYTLSKRTNAYFAYQSIDSNEDNLTAIGLRHSF